MWFVTIMKCLISYIGFRKGWQLFDQQGSLEGLVFCWLVSFILLATIVF